MIEIIEKLGLLVQELVRTAGYPGVFLASLLENVFPPIPSELVMPFAGFLVGRGEMSFLGIVAAGTLGTVLGALLIYYIGMVSDEYVLRRFLRRYGHLLTVSEADLDRALRVFDRHGDMIVFIGRLIPLIRTIISLPAGMKRMPLGRFLVFTTLGSAIWSAILAYAGVVLGANWESLIVFMKRYEIITLGVIGLAVIALLVVLAVRLRRQKTAQAE
jgi:membrane protein DedA with SNARE-associated domain